VVVAAICRAWPEATLLLWPQALFAHEPVDAVLSAAVSELAQIQPQARTTIGAPALFEAAADKRPQLGILPAARALLCLWRCAWKPLLETSSTSAISSIEYSEFICVIRSKRLEASRPTRDAHSFF
jgi:hypothetical protein